MREPFFSAESDKRELIWAIPQRMQKRPTEVSGGLFESLILLSFYMEETLAARSQTGSWKISLSLS